MKNLKNSGQSIIEVLVALFIISLSLSSVIAVVFGGQAVSVDTERNSEGLYKAQKNLEEIRALAKEDFSGVSSTSGTDGDYTKDIIVEIIDEYTKKVTSKISWQTDPLRTQEVRLVTLLSDPQSAIQSGEGSGGGGGLSGDWSNPQTLGSADVGSGNQGTDVAVAGGVVYVSTSASSKSKPDVHVFDISNPSAPAKLSDSDVDAYAVVSLAPAGQYLYGASTGVIPDLKVVNVSSSTNINLAAEYNVWTWVNALSIFQQNSVVYLGVEKTSYNGEFFVIDASNPIDPFERDVFEVNGDVNDIYVSNNIAYVANSRDDKEMLLLDVSDPDNVQELGFLDISGAADGESVFVMSPERIFLGVGNNLYIVNASNPGSPYLVGLIDVGGIVNDIYAVGYLAFLGTSNSNREFQVINISDPENPELHSSLNFPQVATGIDYQNNLVFVSVRSNDALRIITSAQ